MADEVNGNGGVRVSNREIFDTLMAVKEQVDRMVEQNRRGDDIHKDHEHRLTRLEMAEERRKVADEVGIRTQRERSEFWRWFVPAIALVSGTVVTIVQVIH